MLNSEERQRIEAIEVCFNSTAAMRMFLELLRAGARILVVCPSHRLAHRVFRDALEAALRAGMPDFMARMSHREMMSGPTGEAGFVVEDDSLERHLQGRTFAAAWAPFSISNEGRDRVQHRLTKGGRWIG